METVNLRNFKGLYTNIDESDVNHEYLRECFNVKIRPGMMTSTALIEQPFNNSNIIPNNATILYFGKVYIDNDKNGNMWSNNVLIPKYSRDVKEYYLLSYWYNNNVIIKLLGSDNELVKEFLIPGFSIMPKFRVINDKNLIILINKKVYILSKISRYRHTETNKIDDLYLEYLLNDNTNFINADVELIKDGALFNEKIAITDLGNVSVNINRYFPLRKLVFEIINEFDPTRNQYIDMSVFLEKGYFFKGANLSSGEWLFPYLKSPKSYSLPTTKVKEYLICPKNFFEKYFDFDERYDNEIRQYWKIIENPRLVINSDDYYAYIKGIYYVLRRDLFDTNKYHWRTKLGQLVSTVGFERKTPYYEIVGTVIYDNQDEVPNFYFFDNKILSSVDKYGIAIKNVTLASNAPKRITAIAFYFRNNIKDDFEQFAYFNLIEGAKRQFNAYASTISLNGIYLNQTIGTIYDRNKYQIITEADDYKVIGGIPFIINNGNLISGAIGSGNSMNVFYKNNIVPDISNLDLMSIANLSNEVLVSDGNSSYLVSFNNNQGILLFAYKSKMSFSTNNSEHYIEIPEGLIIYTKQGIFLLNGYNYKIISTEINDVVENSYPNGWIEYDRLNELLFYCNGERLFCYDSLYEYWSELNYNGGRIRISNEGNIVAIKNNKIYKLNFGDGFGSIKTVNMDLGNPGILKSLFSIMVDFEGVVVIEDEKFVSNSRTLITKSLRLNNGKVRPNMVRFGLNIRFKGTIYGITLNYNIQGEIPTSKIYSNI